MRKLGQVETIFAVGSYLKTNNTVQGIYLSTKEPLSRNVVFTALEHLIKYVFIVTLSKII